MRAFGFLLTISILVRNTIAQTPLQSLRYNENYSHLNIDSTGNWYQKMKFTRLNQKSDFFVSQGGEVRYLFQHYTNEDWGDSPVGSYNSFYTRFLYHTDLHLSKYFRLFTQLNSTFAMGRVTPIRAIDQNVLDLQQLFFDINAFDEIKVRVGRQEFLYGSQRIISVREGPNNRQSYDAVKLIWKRTKIQADAYYSQPVRVQQGIFDDKLNKQEKLWSTYWVINRVPVIKNIDLYYLGYVNREKKYESGTKRELRHSIGTRIWKKSDTWNYDFEALYQFGSFGEQSINAYTASIDLNYTFNKVAAQPNVGIKTEIISGDKSKTDQQLNTFNPLFPRGAYFGLAALIGPSNLIDFHPSFRFKPIKNLEINADYDIFWRYSLNDGIYGPNVIMLYNSNSDSKMIGHQFGLSLDYQPNLFLKLTPEIMYFIPKKYLEDVSPGKEVFFAAFTAQFKF
jgi:Alginate export